MESARDAGLILNCCNDSNDPALLPDREAAETFEQMIDASLPLTFALNNINRSLGHADVYPFLLFPPVIEKFKFVHEIIERAAASKQARICEEAA